MAAKARVVASSGVDELLFRNDSISLCLLVNRRNKTLRVIDFRAGPTAAKRNFVIAAAQREGVEKIFTLVERDEVATWTRLGLVREGSIPGFYKRSDAWVLGAVVASSAPLAADPGGADEDGGEVDAPEPADAPAFKLAERTVQHARKLLREPAERPLPAVKLASCTDAGARKALAEAARSGRDLTGFEAFGRDVVRSHYLITARGGFELIASSEVQPCFGNSFLELLTSPQNDAERLAATAAVRALCDRLNGEQVASTFAIAPADDVLLAAAFLANGFRRTAVLAGHLSLRGERRDAVIWSRKLTQALDD